VYLEHRLSSSTIDVVDRVRDLRLKIPVVDQPFAQDLGRIVAPLRVEDAFVPLLADGPLDAPRRLSAFENQIHLRARGDVEVQVSASAVDLSLETNPRLQVTLFDERFFDTTGPVPDLEEVVGVTGFDPEPIAHG
jgi:hypothetical protein